MAVGFSLHKHDKIPEQQDDMVRLTSATLDHLTGDALLSGQETIWLMRHAGKLTVNERNDIWPTHRLAALHQNYRRETTAFSEA